MKYKSLCLLLFLFLGLTFSCKDKENPLPAPVDPVEPQPTISDKELLDKVQQATLKYFWDFAHPVSGMARERSSSGDLVTSGGTGFGISAIIVGVKRGWITRPEAVSRTLKICNFLAAADRFHGVWSHWLNGNTGKVIPFSPKDNGGDLVETSFLMNGLLMARAFYTGADPAEVELRNKITQLWETVEWDWYTSKGDGQLYWHWSPQYNWEMNLPIWGWNETLITYILALASPTHAISPAVYQNTFTGAGFRNGQIYEGYQLDIGPSYGGPLFFAHYSFLTLDPRQMQDQYTNYWQQNVKHTLINRSYSIFTAPKAYGYHTSLWGLTASDDPDGYKAHQPTDDNGTIAPTAALGSFPYTPYYSMQVLRYFYSTLAARMVGEYGLYDAFNRSRSWVAQDYLAIDQGPIVVMIENYRSGLFWSLFTNLPEIQTGLMKAGIQKPDYETGFYLAIPEVRSGLYDMLKHPDLNAYVIDVAMRNAEEVSLNLLKEDGALAEVIWPEEVKAAGLYQLKFGTEIVPGKYKLQLKTNTISKDLTVYLH